jgi:hypothetical protein
MIEGVSGELAPERTGTSGHEDGRTGERCHRPMVPGAKGRGPGNAGQRVVAVATST